MKAEDIYPITTVTYPGGDTEEIYISEYHMEQYTPPIEYRAFLDFMRGQTRHINGFYIGDVEKWLSNKKRKEQQNEKV